MAVEQNKKEINQAELPPWTSAQFEAVEKVYGKEKVECLYPITQVAENTVLRGDAWMQTDFIQISFDDTSEDVIRRRLIDMTRMHQALRSVFLIPEGEPPVQAVLKEKEISFVYEDISDRAGEDQVISPEQKAYISRVVSSDVKSPRDLWRGPLLEVKLFRIKSDRAILYLYYSHVLLDGDAVLNITNELLGRSNITPDRELLNRHFYRIFSDSTKEALEFWDKMGMKEGLTSFSTAKAKDSSGTGTSFRSFLVGNEKLICALEGYCARSSVIVSAVLHYCLGKALCTLLGTKSCIYLSVTRGRRPEERQIPGMFAYEFPFVFHEGDTVEDCQAQLVAASKHTWVFKIPGMVPGFEKKEGTVALDVINMHLPDEIRREILPFMDVLDAKAMGDHLSNLHSGPREGSMIFIQSPLALGRLYHGTYCPGHISPSIVKDLEKRLGTELENLIYGSDETKKKASYDLDREQASILKLLQDGRIRILEACPSGPMYRISHESERVCIYLKYSLEKNVNREAISKAILDTQEKFTHIGKGMLEIGNEFYYIESKVPLALGFLKDTVHISGKENGWHAFDVSADGKDILVSADRALIDGVPILGIAQYLLDRYWIHTGQKKPGEVIKLSGTGNNETDLLLLPDDGDWLPVGGMSKNAWTLPAGKGDPAHMLHIVTKTEPVLKLCRKLKSSPSILLGLLLQDAVRIVFPEISKAAFVLSFPVDYRDGMGIKDSLKNASFPVFFNINSAEYMSLDFEGKAKALRNAMRQYMDVRYARGNIRFYRGFRAFAALRPEKKTPSLEQKYESMMLSYLRPDSDCLHGRARVSYAGTLFPGSLVVTVLEYADNFHIWFRPGFDEAFVGAIRESFGRYFLETKICVEESLRVVSEPPKIQKEDLPPCVFFFVNTSCEQLDSFLILIRSFAQSGYQARVYSDLAIRKKIEAAGGACIPCECFFQEPDVPQIAVNGSQPLSKVAAGLEEMFDRDCKVFRPKFAIAGDKALWWETLAGKHGLTVMHSGSFHLNRSLSVLSIDGLQALGKGLHSVVYDYDENRVLKVFADANRDPMSQVKKEQDIAAKMKSLGVPVAGAGEAVLAEHKGILCFGLFFEKAKGVSLGEALMKHPWRLDEYAAAAGKFVRELHSIRARQDVFPDVTSKFMRYVSFYRHMGVLSEAQAKALTDMANLVPDTNSLLHGDLSFDNMMIDGVGMILIDPEQAAVGHPIWDLVILYRNLFWGPGMGMIKGKWVPSPDLSERFFASFLTAYFDSTDEGRIASTKDALEKLSYFWLIGSDALSRMGMPLKDNGLSADSREKLFSCMDMLNDYFANECSIVFAEESR